MARHLEAELGDGFATVGEQALPKGRIGPRLGNHPRAVLRDPLFLDEMVGFLDELAGFMPRSSKRGLDGVDAPFDGGGGLVNVAVVGHGEALKNQILASPAGFEPAYLP